MGLFNKKTKSKYQAKAKSRNKKRPTTKRPTAKSGSGGLASVKAFDWKRNTPIIAVVALAGGYLLWHSFAGTQFYANQYSLATCNLSATRSSNIQVYASPTTKKATTDKKTCQDESAEAMVYRLYSGVYGHAPDKAGYQYWTQKLAGDRVHPSSLTTGLVDSQYKLTVNPSSSNLFKNNTKLVQTNYQSLLGRKLTTSQASSSYWYRQLNSGKLNPRHFTASLANTQAARNYFTESLYQNILGRKAGANGYWSHQSSYTTAQRQSLFKKFVGTPQARTAIVNHYYQAMLGRKADKAGLKYWSSQLASGKTSVASLVTNLANTSEARNHSHSKFLAYTKRTPSPKISPRAAFFQNVRVNQAKAKLKDSQSNVDRINARLHDVGLKQKQALQISYKGEDKISKGDLNHIKHDLVVSKKLKTDIQKTYAKRLANNYNSIVNLRHAAHKVSTYSPDLSKDKTMNAYVAYAKSYTTTGSNDYKVTNSRITSMNKALSSATKKRNAYQAKLSKYYATMAQRARNKTACERSHNIWNKYTATCKAAPSTKSTSSGDTSNGAHDYSGDGNPKVISQSAVGCTQASAAAIAAAKATGSSFGHFSTSLYNCNPGAEITATIVFQDYGTDTICGLLFNKGGHNAIGYFNVSYSPHTYNPRGRGYYTCGPNHKFNKGDTVKAVLKLEGSWPAWGYVFAYLY